MAQDSDPVGNGFIESLLKPGGNITGVSTLAPELNAKGMELLKEVVPKLLSLAFFGTSTNAGKALRFTLTKFLKGAKPADLPVEQPTNSISW